jgi:hypothetical protein
MQFVIAFRTLDNPGARSWRVCEAAVIKHFAPAFLLLACCRACWALLLSAPLLVLQCTRRQPPSSTTRRRCGAWQRLCMACCVCGLAIHIGGDYIYGMLHADSGAACSISPRINVRLTAERVATGTISV